MIKENPTIEEILQLYDFHNAEVELLRHNENMTYKVIDDSKSYVLRIHKPSEGINLNLLNVDASKKELIEGEIELLQFLAKDNKLGTQRVRFNVEDKAIIELKDSTLVTVLEWVEGVTLDSIDITSEIARSIGIMISRMHSKLSSFTSSNRYSYDSALVQRMIEEAKIATALGHLQKHHSRIILDALEVISKYLSTVNNRYIYVHSDLGKSNLIYNEDKIIPIDFSLSGRCIPEMDLASISSHLNDKSLISEVLNGYIASGEHSFSKDGMEICFSLQILLFILCQHNKYSKEAWFTERIDEWCNKFFIHL